jgi:hypothetical protein
MGRLKVYKDDQAYPEVRNAFSPTLSPDGSRFAYFASLDAMSTQLVVDGKPLGFADMMGGQIFFSPDGKHVASIVRPPNARGGMILVDDGYLPIPDGVGYPSLYGFTPDSRHVILRGNSSTKDGAQTFVWHVDGNRAAEVSMMGVTWQQGGNERSFWEAREDGTVAFVGAEPAKPGSYGPMKRFVVTPDPTSDVTTWAADVKAAHEKAEADAKAAKEKADADAKAAKEKADADAKAAREEYNRKRQEALDAKKKAYEDKLAAQKAAKEKAAADAAAKKKAAGN